jgi:mannose-6-phosphate isomerase-like protein (cupin superfamily)
MSIKPFKDFTENYASLCKNGDIDLFEGGDKFWMSDDLDKIGENWLITEFHFEEDWKTWEMHPNGEEIVYMLSGAMDLMLEKDNEVQIIELRGKGSVVIPRNTWHTAKVFAPSNMLVITLGKETQIRAVSELDETK